MRKYEEDIRIPQIITTQNLTTCLEYCVKLLIIFHALTIYHFSPYIINIKIKIIKKLAKLFLIGVKKSFAKN